MTVKLLVDYRIDGKEYKVGNLVTTSAGTEAGLISSNMAVADLTGGTAYVAPVVQPQYSPVTSTVNPLTWEISFSGPDGATIAPTSLASKLTAAFASAKGRNPFDFASGTAQPLVSLVTLNAAAITPGKSVGYFDAGGYEKIQPTGVPYKDTSLSIINNGGAIRMVNPSGISGGGYAGMAVSENVRGSHFVFARVTCAAMQWNLDSSGLSSNFYPTWVNGIQVSPNTPGAITSGSSGNINIAFSQRGTYDVAIGFEQSARVKGITVAEDDEIHSSYVPRLPVVVFGDSYTAGAVSPANAGSIAFVGALSHIGGINAIGSGATDTGYINGGAGAFPMTFAGRLQYTAALINAANAPLLLVPAGYNDVSLSSSAADTQAAATAVFSYLLANTSANIIAFGAQPGKRNNSAIVQAVDAGIAAAVAAIGSSRLAFVAVSGAVAPWISGTRDMANTSGLIAGNSRYYTGNDGVHLSPFITGLPTATSVPPTTTPSSGVEYFARRILDAALTVAKARSW